MGVIRRWVRRLTVCMDLGHDMWPLEQGLGERAGQWLGEPSCQQCGKRKKVA